MKNKSAKVVFGLVAALFAGVVSVGAGAKFLGGGCA